MTNTSSITLCYIGESYQDFWTPTQTGAALSRCFYDINFSLIPFLYLYLYGITQFILFRTSIKPLKANLPVYKRLIFTIPFHLCHFLTFTEIIHLFASIAYQTNSNPIFLSPIIRSIIDAISWLITSFLLYKERYVYGVLRPNGFLFISFISLQFGKQIFSLWGWNNSAFWWDLSSSRSIFDFSIFVTQSLTIFILLVYSVIRPFINMTHKLKSVTEEDEPLINLNERNIEPGSASSEQVKKSKLQFGPKNSSAFSNIFSKCKMLFPYIWPKNSFFLQLRVVAVILILLIVRVTKVFVPIFSKNIVNDLTDNFMRNSSTDTAYLLPIQIPWFNIAMYCFFSFLLGSGATGSGVLANVNGLIWISVTQYTYKKLQMRLFEHLHSLSLRFHLGRKTGAVMKILDRGTSSVTNILHWILFQIAPAIIDIAIAVVYFIIAFDIWFGLLVLFTMMTYIMGTIGITEWRSQWRRAMNELSNEIQTLSVDSLLNFETVKYYNNEEFEVIQISEAIQKYNRQEWIANASLRILNTFQNAIQVFGIFIGSILCAYKISLGELTVGDYVLFTSYLIQLYAPLNFFGSSYRFLQQAFIDMENMFELFDTDLEIQNKPKAPEMVVVNNEVEFRNVTFWYNPEKPILTDISFSIPPGGTVALVGPSGSGKSTIVRLLFRFYDVQNGCILIDGQDISEVTQHSLRKNIGVVPQDTVLFNKSIHFNIRYGRVKADDEEVEKASKAAEIHEQILSMPNDYDTIVGERGLRLSGGEKQRVAIARTLLKSPGIVLLDEATSALDTQTERHIQSSLSKICINRTTLIVAHRLSTIIHSNQILVLNKGRIVERGSHHQLLEEQGLYASMWEEQQKSLLEGEQREVDLKEQDLIIPE
ncbi:ATP-binding cassette sub-family B member 6, mitochondrial-like [Oopsacas minuta]|uniref:ATP-binding cassette sub-family B member 6 n=1 Tax=Oopsacas minuta TaxID=111878 RepID=A0AAV7KKX0_9METZ|nr:ATP-binding cassette sub-family B member 6, mitochondrial-like [Oopsacas minuta]